MKLSANAREAATPNDLDAEDEAVRSTDQTTRTVGSHSTSVVGRAPGIAMRFGKRRVVVLGEAGLLTAQIIRFADGDQHTDRKIGMNVPGYDDRQFALNKLHWLSRLLK